MLADIDLNGWGVLITAIAGALVLIMGKALDVYLQITNARQILAGQKAQAATAHEVKATLAETTQQQQKQLGSVEAALQQNSQITRETHELVNGNLSQLMDASAKISRQLADATPDSRVNEALASKAEDQVQIRKEWEHPEEEKLVPDPRHEIEPTVRPPIVRDRPKTGEKQ